MVALPGLNLDRMLIEEAGSDPRLLAAAIHSQLGRQQIRIDVEQIACALDIEEIRREPLGNLEGALITNAEKGYGSILVNASAARSRQRFTIAHELGHFLNPSHVQTFDSGFYCRKEDFRFRPTGSGWGNLNQHEKQEREANRFAIELLAPGFRIDLISRDEPGLQQIIDIADQLDISKEAAAYRYIDLHPAKAAVFFSKNGQLKNHAKTPSCPSVDIQRLQRLPGRPPVSRTLHMIFEEEARPDDWFRKPPSGAEAWVQTIYQNDGHAMTLVSLTDSGTDDDEDDEAGDAFDRMNRFR